MALILILLTICLSTITYDLLSNQLSIRLSDIIRGRYRELQSSSRARRVYTLCLFALRSEQESIRAAIPARFRPSIAIWFTIRSIVTGNSVHADRLADITMKRGAISIATRTTGHHYCTRVIVISRFHTVCATARAFSHDSTAGLYNAFFFHVLRTYCVMSARLSHEITNRFECLVRAIESRPREIAERVSEVTKMHANRDRRDDAPVCG